MDKYINKEDAIERINRLFIKNHDGSVAKNDYNNGLYAAKAEIVLSTVVSDIQQELKIENKELKKIP